MSTTTGLAARWKINATGEGEYTRRTPYRATFAWQVITIKVWSKSIAELCLFRPYISVACLIIT